MSRTNEELRAIEDYQADFDMFVAKRDFGNAEAVADSMGEQGYETEAMILHRALNMSIAHDLNEKEDVANVEDPMDVTDRRYPESGI